MIEWQSDKYRYRCFKQYKSLFNTLWDNPDKVINNAVRVLKDDPTSTVCKIELGTKNFVIKRTNASKTQGIKRFLPSRAKKNFFNALYLQQEGVATFTPYATIEEKQKPYRSYLVCSYEEGIPALDFYATGKPHLPAWKEKAPLLFELLHKMKKAKISHRDLNLSNILWQKDKWILLDLDGMRKHTIFTAWFGSLRDRLRFMRNWDEYKTVDPNVKQFFLTLHDKYF